MHGKRTLDSPHQFGKDERPLCRGHPASRTHLPTHVGVVDRAPVRSVGRALDDGPADVLRFEDSVRVPIRVKLCHSCSSKYLLVDDIVIDMLTTIRYCLRPEQDSGPSSVAPDSAVAGEDLGRTGLSRYRAIAYRQSVYLYPFVSLLSSNQLQEVHLSVFLFNEYYISTNFGYFVLYGRT